MDSEPTDKRVEGGVHVEQSSNVMNSPDNKAPVDDDLSVTAREDSNFLGCYLIFFFVDYF